MSPQRILSAGRQWRQGLPAPGLQLVRVPHRRDSNHGEELMLLQAILAAVLGTVVMMLSSTTEMQWVQRPASVVPGLATAKLLRPSGCARSRGGRWTS
jgi:hypothetical protein